MTNRIKLCKGLDIHLQGTARKHKDAVMKGGEYALQPSAFVGLVPKVIVKEGEHVKVGEALFVDKAHPEMTFASPVSGIVTAVERGERRKVLSVRVKADDEQQFVEFAKRDVSAMKGKDVKAALIEAGLFGYVNQLPYAVVANASDEPKAIFVSALRDMPLAGDFEFELQGNEKDFQTGLTALSKIAKTYLGVGAKQTSAALLEAKDVEVNIFDGPCPAGNVGIQVNHLDPVNKGDIVWTVDPTAVLFFGRLFNTGKVNLTRTIAIAGSEINDPAYVDILVGAPLKSIPQIAALEGSTSVRLINGNPLTGTQTSIDGFVGAHTSEITAIPEGDHADEMLGWILPRFNQFSANRSYFSWLFGKKKYALDTRVKGGERHMIMSGEYDKVLPMDIYGEYLIKAIITGDIDRQEQLGIYEVSPEDFALAEFVDSSKLELQKIVREGLDILRKENA